mmetsp:Transcript_4478/g.10115  ORF Transcript_4478/g.10115 Transcript_4478/m.10115 type:complete len:258 (-) Transcript_4478:383-1156(-)
MDVCDVKADVLSYFIYILFCRIEKQLEECLEYFEKMRKRQLERRAAKDKEWELSFLDSKTWRNLRIICRGFPAYCRALIDYADFAPDGSIQKLCAISPAQSNSSAIEAWFSCTRGSKQDSATHYAAWVGSRDMFKADKALRNNKMYSAKDVGEVSAGEVIGPVELVKYHRGREKKTNDLIHQYDIGKDYQINEPAPAFAYNVTSNIPASLTELEKDPLRRLAKKTLEKGYLAVLLENKFFRQTIRLSLGTTTGQSFP